MTVIVPTTAHDGWLDPTTPLDVAGRMVGPYPAIAMRAYRVSPRVNSPRNDDASVLSVAE